MRALQHRCGDRLGGGDEVRREVVASEGRRDETSDEQRNPAAGGDAGVLHRVSCSSKRSASASAVLALRRVVGTGLMAAP